MRTTAVLFLLVLAAVAVPAPIGPSASNSLVFTPATVIDVRTGHIFREPPLESEAVWIGFAETGLLTPYCESRLN